MEQKREKRPCKQENVFGKKGKNLKKSLCQGKRIRKESNKQTRKDGCQQKKGRDPA